MIEGLIRPPTVGHAEDNGGIPAYRGSGGGGTTDGPQVYETDLPGIGIDRRSGRYINLMTGQFASDSDLSIARARLNLAPAKESFSGSGLPAGYAMGSNGVVMRQTESGLRPATQAELDSINTPAATKPSPSQGGISGGVTYSYNPNTDTFKYGPQLPGSITDAQKRQNDLTDAALLRRYTVGDRADERRYDTGVRAEDRTYRTGEREAGQVYASGERLAGQEFTAGENDEGRRFSAAESALNRALNAGQFASTLQSNRQRDEYTADESYQNRIRQYGQDQIAGARTVAELTNSVDPTALPAFYRAGGGNIMNAIQAGASAVSDRAVLPAAQALRGTREMALPSRYTFGALNLPAPVSGSSWQPRERYTSQPADSMQSPIPAATVTPRAVVAPSIDGGSWSPGTSGLSWLDRTTDGQGVPDFLKPGYVAPPMPSPASTPAPSVTQAAVPSEGLQWDAGSGFAYGTKVGPIYRYAYGTSALPRYAQGTQDVPVGFGTEFISGDDADPSDPFADGADPEGVTINDPTGDATFSVDPMEAPGAPEGEMAKFGAVLRAIAAMITGETPEAPPMPNRYAYGTGTVDPYATIRPGDQPYFDEIRDIRTKTPYEELNPYSTGYMLGSPTMRASYEMGVQGRYGVPVIDQQQQQRRYQVPTASRGAFQLGV